MNNCLMLVDLQNDYFPGGNMTLAGMNKAVAKAQLLLKEFRKENLPIVHIRHFSTQPGSTFFLPETIGAEINEMVPPIEDEKVVTKNYPNSFRETELLKILKETKINNLIICGAMSHMCIDATTRAAFDHGFNCVVAEDACATKDLIFKGKTIRAAEVHASFMAALSAPYANVLTTIEAIEKIR
ncbi:cysteine hydrolase family protein [Desulfobacula sp.]